MGDLHHIVKIRFSDKTGEMKPVEPTHCPHKNGLSNICVADNGVRCFYMFEEPAAIKKSDRHYMLHCGYRHA